MCFLDMDAEGQGKEENASIWQLIVTVECRKILTWKTWFDFSHDRMKQNFTPEKTMTCPHYNCIICGLTCLIGMFCGETKPVKSGFLQICKLCSLQMSFDHFLPLKKHIEANLRPCFCWLDTYNDTVISLPTSPRAEELNFPVFIGVSTHWSLPFKLCHPPFKSDWSWCRCYWEQWGTDMQDNHRSFVQL